MKRLVTALALALTISLYVAEPSSAQKTDAAAVRKAIEKSLPLLESLRVPFIKNTGCVSCHHNSMPALAAGLARERGFNLDQQITREESEQILGIWRLGREKLLQGDGFGGAQSTASYVLAGLAANGQPANKTTDAIVHYLLGKQGADGRWVSNTNRPPSAGSDFAVTALSLRAVQAYAPPAARPEIEQRVTNARQWLRQAIPHNNEDRAFQLLGLAWAHAEPLVLRKLTQALLAQQRKDGGWSQQPMLASDAYATGQALVALAQGGGLPVNQRAYQRGVRYLVNDQAPDGSWLVLTRSFPFQRQFESGFPYGYNQWISAAASSWATMALTLTIEAAANSAGNSVP